MGLPPRLSRWAWAADAVLAVLLLLATVNGTLNANAQDGPAPPAVFRVDGERPPPPDRPLPPDAPLPPDRFSPPERGPHADISIGDRPPSHAQLTLYVLLAALTALPLVLRRRYPLAAFSVVLWATLLYHSGRSFDPTFTFASCVIAAYSAAMYSPYHRPAVTAAAVGAVLIAAGHDANVPELRPGLVTLIVLIPIGLAANAIHTWKQRVRTLEAERDAATLRAVERERSRIAQELHDVVTHNVSVMVVQAGAARMVMREAPERAQEALLAVESGGRAAMTELRHAMGLLTMNGDAARPPEDLDLAPKPGLDQVPALAERVRATGVDVELTETGTPAELPAGIDLAAYRVVQESLTNALKHAAGAAVRISVEHGPGALLVEVTDTGGGAAPAARTGGGHGLIGLRERAAVYGGTLEAGPRPGGGYRVRARFPLEAR